MSRSQVRCAIYTRKSTEDGLDQEFNSLDAQREACSAYITSQRSQGWTELADRFDDGGVSGGTLDRPSLEALFAAISAGQIDMVVVYKVDRLTRSLTDFGKIVERFDAHSVSFVSVTQSFNTSTSMGRLTLNMLLSFAQFEREVTAERIKDKILASRKKGMWTGGVPPFGYEVRDKALHVFESEAQIVRVLFNLYLETKSVTEVRQIAQDRGYRTRIQPSGRGGQAFGLGTLYALLKNPLYAGLVRAGDELAIGRHDPIIARAIWEDVQAQLDANSRFRGKASKASAPLQGKLHADGEILRPHHATKGQTRYRYYVSPSLIRRVDPSTEGWRLPAAEIEAAVRDTILDELTHTDVQATKWLATDASADRIAEVTNAIIRSREALRALGTAKALRVIANAVKSISLTTNQMSIHLNPNDLVKRQDNDLPGSVAITRSIRLRRRRFEQRLIVGAVDRPASFDHEWAKILPMVIGWRERLMTGTSDLQTIAKEAGIDRGHASRLLPLAFLAPDVQTALIEGRVGRDLTLADLREIAETVLSWPEQRRRIGLQAA